MAGKGSPEDFFAYRHWVCTHVDLLLSGAPAFWKRFARLRSHLRNSTEPIGSRFDWEKPFLTSPALKGPISRRELCHETGISRDRLRRFERAGLFCYAPPNAEDYGPYQAKQLQWILFFVQEMGIRIPGLSAILSLEGTRNPFKHLASSTTPDVPIHRSLPIPFPADGKRVDSRREPRVQDARELRALLHEIGNKLHVIAGRADRLRRKLPGNALADKNLTIILSQSERASKALADIRNLISPPHPTSTQREKGA